MLLLLLLLAWLMEVNQGDLWSFQFFLHHLRRQGPPPVKLIHSVIPEVDVRLLSLWHGVDSLLLLGLTHGSVSITKRGLLLEELVHFKVGPCDHIGGLRPASLVAGGGLLLSRGVDEGGLVPGGQVGQL